jgi:predicted transcriptional regulator
MGTMARLKKMISFAIDPELLRRLEKWIGAQDVPPSKTAVHEAALREFLDKRERRGK